MSEQKFQVVVNGALTGEAESGQVKRNIANLFKTSLEKVEPMFSGRKLAVKKGLDRETAQKYQAAIVQAGLAAAVVPMTAVPRAATGLDSATLAATGSIMDKTPPLAQPDIDVGDLSMGQVGEDMMEYQPVPEAQIDTSGLSMGEVGEDVTEHEEVPPADIDTSKLSLDEPSK